MEIMLIVAIFGIFLLYLYLLWDHAEVPQLNRGYVILQNERPYGGYRHEVNRRESTLNIRTRNNAIRYPSVRARNETASPVQPKVARVSVIEVPDGDGVKAFDDKANAILDVRLIGIDAPEMKGRQPFALEAKRHLERLVLHETVILTKYNLDQYGRVLGHLRVPGKVDNVSLEMLRAGLAEVYKGKGVEFGGMCIEFYEAQRRARMQKKGLWVQDRVTSPREHKIMQRFANQTTSTSWC